MEEWNRKILGKMADVYGVSPEKMSEALLQACVIGWAEKHRQHMIKQEYDLQKIVDYEKSLKGSRKFGAFGDTEVITVVVGM